jgi:acetylornithine/N-succinyldiaminopimelate aminotransferase
MQGIVCAQPAKEIMERCLAQGLLVNVTRDRVIRLLPPLIIAPEHVEQALAALRNAFLQLELPA